jgi:glucosamine 6-phosphate synthetase-like amidotransferase/phosphosugar isomerase protein
VLDNLGSLNQHYGLSKGANEVLLVIEAYKALRDRAPYPVSFMLSQLTGSYAFVLFDKTTSSLLVASVRFSLALGVGRTVYCCSASVNDAFIYSTTIYRS